MKKKARRIAAIFAIAVIVGGILPGASSAQTKKTWFQLETRKPGCFWSDEKKEMVCITPPRKPPPPPRFPRLTGGGGCGGSAACGGSKREPDPQNLPDARQTILTIEPGTLDRAGRIQTLTRSTGNR